MDYGKVLGLISPHRRELSRRFVFEKDRRLSAAAGYFMKRIEEEYGVSVSVDQDGKPQTDRDDVHFNISHSGGYAVCVISEHPVGVDIEQIGNNNDLAPTVMMPSELEIFRRMSEDIRNEVFCRMWTIKESYMKARGKGLSIPPDTLDVIRPEGLDHEVFCRPFRITEMGAPEGYRISVCHHPSETPSVFSYLL